MEVGPEEVAVVEVGPGPSHLLRGLVLDLHVLVVGAGEVLPLTEHVSGIERRRVSFVFIQGWYCRDMMVLLD